MTNPVSRLLPPWADEGQLGPGQGDELGDAADVEQRLGGEHRRQPRAQQHAVGGGRLTGDFETPVEKDQEKYHHGRTVAVGWGER